MSDGRRHSSEDERRPIRPKRPLEKKATTAAAILLLALGLMSAVTPSGCATLTRAHSRLRKHAREDAEIFDDNLQKYLTDFGYLSSNTNREIANLRTTVAVKHAIARMQEFASLNVTMTLDEPTQRLMRQKRCGMPDLPYDGGGSNRAKRFTLFGSKWDKLRLTYKVVNTSPYMDQGSTRRSVYDAFKLWSDASSLEFTETVDDEADIIIRFERGDHGDGHPFDGNNVVLAHAFFPGSGLGGDAHFDADEIWTNEQSSNGWTARGKVNFFLVAAHEFGHSLGLGHSKDRNSLMYPYYKDFSSLAKLPYDDALGIQKIYGIGGYGIPEPPTSTTPMPEHATYPPNTRPYDRPPSYPSDVQEQCGDNLNAVARIRNEIFVFKNRVFWRFNDSGMITVRPTEIPLFWMGLPHDLDRVDAVYERPEKGTVIFFRGRQYWEFNGNTVLEGHPRDISALGLPAHVKRIDAAFVWDWNKKAYLFVGDEYYRLDESTFTVEHDYPRKLKDFWVGVPANVDAAFTDKLGTTFFFKDSQVYKFHDYFSRVDKQYPVPIAEFWPQCRTTKNLHLPYLRKDAQSPNSAPKAGPRFVVCFLLAFLTTFCSFFMSRCAKPLRY